MRLRFVSCVIGFAALSACGKWEPRDRITSPNGEAVANVEVKLLGASSSNLTRISLDNAGSGKLISPGEVVSADGAIVDATRIAWTSSDRLKVILCEATQYRVRANLLRDPITRNDGSENTITVNVENWRYSESLKRCIPV
jgi:hypothetical protein